MAKINKVMVGESLVGDGNEVAHVDLLIGPRGSAVETAFCNALTNNKDGFTSLLAVVAPNLLTKPNTILFNKVTIKGAKQAVQMFGPAQYAVAKAVADSVADGTIPADEADDLFICVGVFIHWLATDDKKIQDFNYRATKEALAARRDRQADGRRGDRAAQHREAPLRSRYLDRGQSPGESAGGRAARPPAATGEGAGFLGPAPTRHERRGSGFPELPLLRAHRGAYRAAAARSADGNPAVMKGRRDQNAGRAARLDGGEVVAVAQASRQIDRAAAGSAP